MEPFHLKRSRLQTLATAGAAGRLQGKIFCCAQILCTMIIAETRREHKRSLVNVKEQKQALVTWCWSYIDLFIASFICTVCLWWILNFDPVVFPETNEIFHHISPTQEFLSTVKSYTFYERKLCIKHELAWRCAGSCRNRTDKFVLSETCSVRRLQLCSWCKSFQTNAGLWKWLPSAPLWFTAESNPLMCTIKPSSPPCTSPRRPRRTR